MQLYSKQGVRHAVWYAWPNAQRWRGPAPCWHLARWHTNITVAEAGGGGGGGGTSAHSKRASDKAARTNYLVSASAAAVYVSYEWPDEGCFQHGCEEKQGGCTACTPDYTVLETKKKHVRCWSPHPNSFFSFSVGFDIKHYHPCVWSCYPLISQPL